MQPAAQAAKRAADLRQSGVCAPFCHTCDTEHDTKAAPLATCHICEDRFFCPDDSRKCVACGMVLCEGHALIALDPAGRCEDCAYVASIAPEKLCPVCKAQEIGQTIPTCLVCHWKATTDGIKKSADSFRRIGEELSGKQA